MRRLFFLALVLAIGTAPLHAQDTLRTPSEPPEWGEVSPQTLRAHSFPSDSNASAVILSDHGHASYKIAGSTPEIEIEYHTRVKILRESGYEAGRVTIAHHGELHDVEDVEGRTYTLTDGTIETHELSGDDIFEEDLDGELERTRFTLPELEPGAVIEYRYELDSENVLHIPSWDFQHAHPTLYSEYEVAVPSALKFVTITTGSQDFDTVNQEQTSDLRAGRQLKKTWIMKDVPALREEPYMTTLDDYRSRIRLQARELRNPNTGTVMKRFMTTWPDLAKTQLEADYFGDGLGDGTGGFLSGEGALEKKVDRLVEGLSSDSARMHAVYDYVRSSIEWNGTLDRSRDQDFEEIFESKTGNSAEVNLLLVSMLRLAGLEAHPVMISTRDHGKVFPLYPLVTQFNSVIAAVQLPDREERVLLDPTEPLCPPSMLPERDLNRQGWLVREDNPKWIEISPPSETGRRVYVRGTVQADGTLTGTISVQDRGFPALEARRSLRDKDPSTVLKDNLLGHLPDVSLSEVTVKNQDTLSRPLETSATFETPGYARTAGDMLYLKPHLVPAVEENPFKRKDRSFPVDFAHPQKVSYILSLRLPKGYEVKDVPENRRVVLSGDNGSFSRLVQAQGRQVMVRSTLELSAARIAPKGYDGLRELFTRAVSSESEQLVLQKSSETAASSSASGDQ